MLAALCIDRVMAYDLHIGLHLNNHKYRASIDENSHFELFSPILNERKKFHCLLKLADYFEDAKLEGEEITQLLDEVKEASEVFKNEKSILTTLNAIENVGKEAIEKGLILYGFCD